MEIIIQRILFYEASSKLGKKVTRRVDEKLQRSISCARDDGPRLARLQRGVTSRYTSRATFFARSSSNFASILHSAKILDEALPFFHAPSKNRLPPLIRLTRSSGVFHKERNSLLSRVLVTRLTIVVKISPSSTRRHLFSILIRSNSTRKSRGNKVDSKVIRIFLLSYPRTFEPRCGNIRLREKRRKGKGRKKSLEERHNGKTPRGTRVSTSLESQRAINHQAANIDWQINPEIEASSRSDQSQSEK